MHRLVLVLCLLGATGLAQDPDPTAPSEPLRRALEAVEAEDTPARAAAPPRHEPQVPAIELKARIGTDDTQAALLQVGERLLRVRQGQAFTVQATNNGQTLRLTVQRIDADVVRISGPETVPEILLR